MDDAARRPDERGWPHADLRALGAAYQSLEHPGFAARTAELLGAPIEFGLKKLPAGWRNKVHQATETALQHALEVALKTLDENSPRYPGLSSKIHKLAVVMTGTAGGALGFVTLAIELPVTTMIMLRSIADIARAEGEDLRTPEARLSCLEVFALGGPRGGDDAAETGYFAVRLALAQQITKAAEHILQRGVAEQGAPAVVRLITRVAQRFSVQVSEKIAAEAVPLIGAVGGATINVLFMDHFQSMARGHFTIRRLERKHGRAEVRERYEALHAARAGQ